MAVFYSKVVLPDYLERLRRGNSLRLAREHGSTVTLDTDFGKDVEAAVESHRE